MNRLTLALAGVLALAGALMLGSSPVSAQNCSGQPAANTVCAGPTSGGAGFPGFRALVSGDLPSIFTNDAFFGSGRPWCDVQAHGAKIDGSTDDTAAFTACKTALQALGGGILRIGPGTACLKSGFSLTGSQPILMQGAGKFVTTLSACSTEVTPVTWNAGISSIRDLTINGNDSLTTTHSALVLGSSCTECLLEHIEVVQGYYGIDIAASDYILFDVKVDATYGPALIHNSGAGAFFKRVKLDQNYVGPVPSAGTSFAAWASGTPYTLGTVVSLSGFYIQNTQAGTSGGSPPTIATYGSTFADGTARWTLIAPTTSYGLHLDGGSAVVFIEQGDFTGPFVAGILIDNANAGTVPADIFISSQNTFGDNLTAGILATAGHHLTVSNNTIGGCVFTGCAGVAVTTSFTGALSVVDNQFHANDIAIDVEVGDSTSIVSNLIGGGAFATPTGIKIGNLASRISITANKIGMLIETLGTGINIVNGVNANPYEISANTFDITVATITDPTPGANAYVSRTGSIVLGNPTGGNEGSGTINLTGDYYKAGVKIAETVSAPLVLTAGNITCPTCTTSAASLTANQLVIGSGSQGEQTLGSLGTTTTVLHGNAAGAPTFGAVSLTADITGVLAGVNGGTGLSTAAIGDIIYASATTPTWSRLADVAAGSVLVSGGVNTAPAWSTSPSVNLVTLANGTSNGLIFKASGGSNDATLSEGAGGGLLFTMGTANSYQVRDHSGSAVLLTAGATGSSVTEFQDAIAVGTTSISGTLETGEIAMAKKTASVAAPGGGFCKEEWVAGTTAGTCKKIAFCGTSTTPTTIIDNVGGSC